jgi:hypothetical protein
MPLLLKAIARQSPAFRDGSADLPVTTMILRLMVVKRRLIGVPQGRGGFGTFPRFPGRVIEASSVFAAALPA